MPSKFLIILFVVVCSFTSGVIITCSLLVTHLRLEAHCDVSYNELVLLQLEGSLEKGEFDARSGVIAGRILMEDVAVHGM